MRLPVGHSHNGVDRKFALLKSVLESLKGAWMDTLGFGGHHPAELQECGWRCQGAVAAAAMPDASLTRAGRVVPLGVPPTGLGSNGRRMRRSS
eukprot:scaffold3270_cov170-Isochrysis_galbana.AAC.1